jgi:hypothetical protein
MGSGFASGGFGTGTPAMQLLLMVVTSDEGGGPWLTRTRTPPAGGTGTAA